MEMDIYFKESIIPMIKGFIILFLILSAGCSTVQAFVAPSTGDQPLKEYNLGEVSIKELQDFSYQKRSENYIVHFIIEGTIRDVANTFHCTVDDESGRLRIAHGQVGLGGINDGDIVIVEGYVKNNEEIATKISLASNSNLHNSNNNISPKISGFGFLLTITSILFISRLFYKRKIRQ